MNSSKVMPVGNTAANSSSVSGDSSTTQADGLRSMPCAREGAATDRPALASASPRAGKVLAAKTPRTRRKATAPRFMVRSRVREIMFFDVMVDLQLREGTTLKRQNDGLDKRHETPGKSSRLHHGPVSFASLRQTTGNALKGCCVFFPKIGIAPST
ncbi:hypothetical protein WLU04_06830 [Bordetella bronchiseptica]|uniref:hypothetical protein n=1 Tax=Bordetella bronchiseptica TaxID=518 RepID=UPI001ED9987E|nr:hypothetical protein [Bordetella bronchiseptica]WLS66361.1 hypothetical protein RAK11_13700 [Bordetella bronchiseptica]